MRKILCTFVAIFLLSGCSGVSQADYNTVVEERDKLKTQVAELERQSPPESSQSAENKMFSTEATLNKTIAFENENQAILAVFENENPKSSSVLCTFDGKDPELEFARIAAFMLLFDKLEIKDYMISSMVTNDEAEATVIICKNGEMQPSVLMSEKYKLLSGKGVSKELQEISFKEFGAILEQLAN